ncbi:hypothetical protein DSCO28_61410 [Desulfosarcina ovata subsp. sediminis]|uniref:Uncharacterized protein n=1 Tax=Desulfosarcina ovata subsp. sediminis TaxID=885957 RepID=A0A5K7ZZ61_9BACT|nr:hypothetical protein [Desulfosarcina ovata]BBO85575.1 hypothetical protein DSCO28_61410 [Desulfosarcina ovata subsp. sediminis]
MPAETGAGDGVALHPGILGPFFWTQFLGTFVAILLGTMMRLPQRFWARAELVAGQWRWRG